MVNHRAGGFFRVVFRRFQRPTKNPIAAHSNSAVHSKFNAGCWQFLTLMLCFFSLVPWFPIFWLAIISIFLRCQRCYGKVPKQRIAINIHNISVVTTYIYAFMCLCVFLYIVMNGKWCTQFSLDAIQW